MLPTDLPDTALRALAAAGVLCPQERLQTGVDVVQVADVAQALRVHGARYVARVFTEAEAAYAAAEPALQAQRLAVRYAAKEAALKALRLTGGPTRLRELEVLRADDGSVRLAVHGASAAQLRRDAVHTLSLSLSHDGDYAVAFVVALTGPGPGPLPFLPATPTPTEESRWTTTSRST